MIGRFTWCTSALCLLVISALPTAAQAKVLPVSDFIRHPAFSRVVISPDGKHLAVVSAVKDSNNYQLAILPTRSVLEHKPKITAHYGLTDYEHFGGVFWVNDERVVAATVKQQGGFARPFLTGNLYASNVRGGQKKTLMGQGTGLYFRGLLRNTREHDSRHILVFGTQGSSKPIAYWLDVYTGSHHQVAASPLANGWLLADQNGDVRLAGGTNAKTGWPELYYRPADSMDWQDKTKLIRGKHLAAAALQTGSPIMFTPDNESVYAELWTDNTAETLGLYRYNFEDGKKKLIYANPIVDVAGVMESFNRKSIVGLWIEPGKLKTIALDPKAPRIQLMAALSQALPNVQVAITSWTRDGSEAVVKTWGDTVPGTYYLYASKPKPSLTFLFHETPWIKPDDLSPMKPISFQSRDGLTIHGYLTVPRGVKAKDLPMVVYVHGGPHGIRTTWGFSPGDFDSVAEQILANHGYAVLALNYRGSGGYGLKFLEAGFRHWGDTMQNDLADGVAWAVKQGYANPKHVCIFGASYGGYAALMSAERFPDLYQCAVGYSGVYDLSMLESRASSIARHAGGRLYLKTVLGHDEKQLRAFSPIFHADKLKIPVFLLHGGRDFRAPDDAYVEMKSAIEKHGTPLETLYYRNELHGFYKPAHREKAWKEMLAFFGKYIGPGVTPASGSPTSLTPLVRVAPKYPSSARIAGFQGDVTTCFTVKSDGSVSNARIKTMPSTRSGDPRTNGIIQRDIRSATLDAIRQWKFVPRKVNGELVAVQDVCQTIRYRLKK